MMGSVSGEGEVGVAVAKWGGGGSMETSSSVSQCLTHLSICILYLEL